MKKIIITIISFGAILALVFFMLASGDKKISECAKCHEGIEETSASHRFECVECHGGDPNAKDMDIAHAGMYGGKNPSSPQFLDENTRIWDKGCSCHEYRRNTVLSSLMFTNAGMVKNIQLAWGEAFEQLYSNMAIEGHDSKGNPVKLKGVEELDSMSSLLYQKFCAACHVSDDIALGWMSHRSGGCAACHFSYNERGVYMGGDMTVFGLSSYSITHTMNPLPGNDVCMHCHNRSGRISLSYEGLYDGNNSMVPTKHGEPGPMIIDGIRNVRHMKADIHHEAGMECIDCHTADELMGDGYVYENMYDQLEITCQSCHGDGYNLPRTQTAVREMNRAFVGSQSYKQKIPNGAEMVLTDKDRFFSNVFKEDDKYWLVGKRDGKKREVKTLKGTAEHSVIGHVRLECATCHSRTVIQCYGCHTLYDEREMGYNFLKKEESMGRFFETEDLRTFYPFPLGVNERGKISPLTPGCQTFFTHIDSDGKEIKSGYLFDFRGQKMLKFAPFYSHNTGKKAIECRECHSNPFFWGYGDGLFSHKDQNLISTILCDGGIPLNALYSIEKGKKKVVTDVVRENARVLSVDEIDRIIDANRCIICHQKADHKYYNEEIYGGAINYDKILDDPVHRPLLR